MGDPDYHDPRIAGYWVWGICAWIGSGFCSGVGPWESVGGKLVKTGGRGINRQLPHLGNRGAGINRQLPRRGIYDWFVGLSDILRGVRVCCGDWARVLGNSPTTNVGKTGVFLDPPYCSDLRDEVYSKDDFSVAMDCAAWAVENGNRDDLLIALCGYEGDYNLPGWACVAWHAIPGYQTKNARKERIWLSPSCARANRQVDLFKEQQ
jgi:hypothetical protein